MNVFIQFEKKPLYFTRPRKVISCHDPSKFDEAWGQIEEFLSAGYYIAGFLSYEAGYGLEEKLRTQTAHDFPLLLMGAYRVPQASGLEGIASGGFKVRGLHLNISKDDYAANIARIRAFIARGDVYQITYCLKLLFDLHGNPRRLFQELFSYQPVLYPAYLEAERFKVLSLSPERFLKKTGRTLLSEPMKGTWRRGQNVLSDLLARRRFMQDVKNKAENVMIADLLRNDLGRIASAIAVPKLFTVTGYRTLFQMTSTVTGRLSGDRTLKDIFTATFPSGSVTGAPKIRAMEIIRMIEREERKIYTGAIGYITPVGDLYFNIPIRTVLIEGHRAEMGIGGGIVWDSTAQSEWDEGLLKARFLTDLSREPFNG